MNEKSSKKIIGTLKDTVKTLSKSLNTHHLNNSVLIMKGGSND